MAGIDALERLRAAAAFVVIVITQPSAESLDLGLPDYWH